MFISTSALQAEYKLHEEQGLHITTVSPPYGTLPDRLRPPYLVNG